MHQKLRVSVVSYLNSVPFVYALAHGELRDAISLHVDVPSTCASKLLKGEVDCGLVPVAALPELGAYHVVSKYCIAADGDVDSVLLLSQVPLPQIRRVLCDYQSRTSVTLAKVLARRLWRISPQWEHTAPGYEKQISGSTAGVVIGDRAMHLHHRFPFVYDLSGEWKKLTRLPFVFACWAARDPFPEELTERFNECMRFGLENIETALALYGTAGLGRATAERYLRKTIRYSFGTPEQHAMETFLSYLHGASEESRVEPAPAA